MKYEQLRDNIIDIFNSMSFTYKMYNENGKAESNPYNARYFFVDSPNIMLIVDDSTNSIEFHRSNFNFELFKRILKMLRNITKKYFVKLHVSTYNTSITPKTFSREVLRKKTQKSAVYEQKANITGSDIDPVIEPCIIKEYKVSYVDKAFSAYANHRIDEATLDNIVFVVNNMHLNEDKVHHLIALI